MGVIKGGGPQVRTWAQLHLLLSPSCVNPEVNDPPLHRPGRRVSRGANPSRILHAHSLILPESFPNPSRILRILPESCTNPSSRIILPNPSQILHESCFFLRLRRTSQLCQVTTEIYEFARRFAKICGQISTRWHLSQFGHITVIWNPYILAIVNGFQIMVI